jgi:hypothetical protein
MSALVARIRMINLVHFWIFNKEKKSNFFKEDPKLLNHPLYDILFI